MDKISSACFVIDCPVNAMIASFLAKQYDAVHIIYPLDPACKDIDEYLRMYKILLDGLNVISEDVIEIDSALFWGKKRSSLLPIARKALKSLMTQYAEGTVYFGNCLTNPVAIVLKDYAKLNHLYHSPTDFASVLFPKSRPIVLSFKRFAKWLFKRDNYDIEIGNYPIYSLLNFSHHKNFQHLDICNFHSHSVQKILADFCGEIDVSKKNVMLLLAGDEPEPGDDNCSNISKYLTPHYQAVENLMMEDNLNDFILWVKEHKSYLPLTIEERSLLSRKLSKLGCKVRFVADYLPREYRILPGEYFIKYGKIDYVISEPSSFLFNVAGSSTTPVAAVTAFAPFRTKDQVSRNDEFVSINQLLEDPVRIY